MALTAITTLEEFQNKVLPHEGLSVVSIWADWCAPCKVMVPEIEEAAKMLDGQVEFFSMSADEVKEVCLKYNVEGVPTILMFRNGKAVDRMAGYKKADIVVELIKKRIK